MENDQLRFIAHAPQRAMWSADKKRAPLPIAWHRHRGHSLPELQMPLATYTGWGLRSGVWAKDGCEATGQYIPFKTTQAERVAAGDPRPSVQERYQSYNQYRSMVIQAVSKLVKQRFVLCDDAQGIVTRLLQAGLAAGVPAPNPNANSTTPTFVPACNGSMPLPNH